MFESCHHSSDSDGSSTSPRCADVAEKLAQLFGWRQTYKVEKLQRSLADSVARRSLLQQQQELRIQLAAESVRKSTDSWVVVHNLQSQSDGGILDPDDRLNDVADDREQIIANFEDGDGHHHGGGDGASGSSVGTGSPDIFQSENTKFQPFSRTDIEVTGEQIASGLIAAPLQVRRGSEPALNQLVPATTGGTKSAAGTGGASAGNGSPAASSAADPSKRWSATPIVVGDEDEVKEKKSSHHKEDSHSGRLGNGYLSPDWSHLEKVNDEDERASASSAFTRFVRDGSNRLSMQFLGDSAGGFRWADAAERMAIISGPAYRAHSKSLPRDHRRKEPLGQANSTSPIFSTTHHHSHSHVHDSDIEDDLNSESVEYVVMHNESGPLGIHVVPDYDRLGKDRGLVVQGIEPGGRIDRDGRLAVYDRIIEINGQNLLNMPFQRVQEIFKGSLRCPELQLRVIKHHSSAMDHSLKKPPPPVFPRSIRGLDDRENIAMVEGEERPENMRTKIATVSPTKKVSPAPRNAATSLQTANTRKIGRKIELELTKGVYGLGFSITTRDNPAGGNCPIYIKNILPKGAAVEDGRLKPGDRLLEVNGVEMTGKTQAEAVSVLRNAPQGSKVSIVVSRQEDSSTSPRLPRQIVAPEPMGNDNGFPPGTFQQGSGLQENLVSRTSSHIHEPPEKVHDDGLVFPWKHREILTFDIPVHDTEKAGLGVSVKGKTTASHGVNHGNESTGSSSVDLGIFVKSVLHGGAASRDGRLRTNDQLLNVNGISLLAQSNSDAMETLRRAMLHTEGPIPGVISLTIARRVSSPGPHSLSNGHQHSQSGRDSVSSLLTSSSGTETFVCGGGNKSENEAYTPDNSGTSENSDNTVIFLPYKDETDHSRESSHLSAKSPDKSADNAESVSSRNPVIDRLTGQVTNQNLNPMRNESYYRATHETWNTTMLLSGGAADKLTSPTVNLPSGEMVLIEEEYTPHNLPAASQSHRIGKSLPEKAVPCRTGEVEKDERAGPTGTSSTSGGPASDQSSDTHTAEITYASQLSLEEAAGFTRDAFGRQSMSEKRHATLDAKHTDTYQRNKKLREERERQRHMQLQQQQFNDQKKTESHIKDGVKPNREIIASSMIRANSVESIISVTRSQADSERLDVRVKNEFGPSLGMKKSSSLESLQTMVQEIQMQEESDPAYTYRNAQGAVRVIRGRGCNESFRAAVDRSYEAPLSDLRSRIEMETLAEEDGPQALSMPIDCGPGMGPSAFGSVRGGPRQSSLNAVLDSKNKPGKKKPGIFRGIGSMFRFGKHRKTLDVPLQLALRAEQEGVEGGEGPCGGEEEREAARRAAQEEQQRIQEQYRRLMQRQRQLENQVCNNLHEHVGTNASTEPGGPLSVGIHHSHHCREGSTSSASSQVGAVPGGASGQSRTERIHQLRAQHQRRHAERRGQYPLDDREERYEEVIRQRLEQPEFSNTQQQAHVRSASYDLYGEMTRPGSRVGITDPARFSHYVNYEEIQQHLNRRQQHYHSQRRDNREPHQRPVSNFYEYESVQSVMRSSQHHDEALRSNQLQNEAMRSSQHQDEVMRSNQLQSEAMRSIQRRDEAMKSTKQHRDEAMRSKQHRDEGMRCIQHQDEGMKSSQHQEESQKPNQNRNDALRASQHQRGTTIAVDNNSNNSLQRRMQLQENRGINNKNNNGVNIYQHPFQSSTSSKYGSNSNTHIVNINGSNHHMRTSHMHDIDQRNNHSGSNSGGNSLPALPLVHNVGQSNHHTHGNRGVSNVGSKVNNITGRTQGPFVTHVTIGQQMTQIQPSGSKV